MADQSPAPSLAVGRRHRLVVVAALVATAAVLAVRSGVFTPSHPVPSLVGKTLAQADQAVHSRPLRRPHRPAHAYSITARRGPHPQPAPGAGSEEETGHAKQGSTIDVVVSAGPPPVTIPNVAAIATCAQAIADLKTVNLVGVCPAAAEQYSSTVGAGAVIGTSPAKTARYGSTVTIVISKGHAPVVVPAVTGSTSTYASASAALTGRRVRAQREPGSTAPRSPPARSSAPPRRRRPDRSPTAPRSPWPSRSGPSR